LRDCYRLDHELGQGGMATVYLAHDLKHDRDVALKVLRPELAAVLGRDRFLTEVRLTAKLDHPHILTLIEVAACAQSPLTYSGLQDRRDHRQSGPGLGWRLLWLHRPYWVEEDL
jgi:serine/threonine protein kinase